VVNVSAEPEAFREFEYSGWQRAVDRYHAGWGELTGQAVGPMLDALGVGPGDRLLDVASGPGYVAAAAAARGADVTGVDFSPAMVDKARALHPGGRFIAGDAHELPVADQAFDAVSMGFGMLHLARPEAAMREAWRALRPGGRYAFTVWAPPEHTLGFQLVLGAVERHGEAVPLPHGPDFFHYGRPEAARAGLLAAGFSAPEVTLVEMVWRPPGAEAVFPAFADGTARTGGLLRRQPPAARRAIEADVRRAAARFVTAAGTVEIPMPAVLAWATRP
jgi:SAM-dependent methyltransferase